MRQGSYRLSRRIAMVCSVLLPGVFIAWLAVLATGIVIPLDGFRNSIESAISRALDREVRIEGGLALRPALSPTIMAHNVHIASLPGNDESLQAGRIMLQLAPVSLLRGEPRGMRLQMDDVVIVPETQVAVAQRPDTAGAVETGMQMLSELFSASVKLLQEQPELQQLVLQRVVVSLGVGATEQPYQAKFREISVHTRPGMPLEMMIRGRFQKQPYTIELTGGRLEELLTSTEPWPLQVAVSFADTRLLINGNLEAAGQGLAAAFELHVDWPAEFAGFARVSGQYPLSGRLVLHTDQGRPVVSGELQLPAIDTVLQLGADADSALDAATRSARDPEGLSGKPGALPLTAWIAGVPFQGRLVIGSRSAETVAELSFLTTDVSPAGLLGTLTGTTGINGSIDHIGFQASVGRGHETTFLDKVALALQIDGARLSYGNAAGERPVDFSLEELALSIPAGGALNVLAQGTLRGVPFSAELNAGLLEALLKERSWPVTLTATGGSAELDINGSLAAAHDHPATHLNLGLDSKRIGDMSPWLGISPCVDTSFELRGQLILSRHIRRLQFLRIQTDRTRLSGELDWSGDDQIDLLHALLHFDELDPADIEMLVPLVNHDSDNDDAGPVAIDIPVMPGLVVIENADIDLDIAHIVFELLDITDLSLSARLRQGRMQRSSFHTHIDNISFQGYLDPATAETTVVFEDEGDDGIKANRLDKLKNRAIRWVGNAAIIPLRWLFRKKLSGMEAADCRIPGHEYRELTGPAVFDE